MLNRTVSFIKKDIHFTRENTSRFGNENLVPFLPSCLLSLIHCQFENPFFFFLILFNAILTKNFETN